MLPAFKETTGRRRRGEEREKGKRRDLWKGRGEEGEKERGGGGRLTKSNGVSQPGRTKYILSTISPRTRKFGKITFSWTI